MMRYFITVLVVTCLFVHLYGAERPSKEFACITEYIDEGLIPRKVILEAKNPIDVAFTKGCEKATCNTNAKNAVYHYSEAWKSEFENVIRTILSSLKNPDVKRDFVKYRDYILASSDVNLIFVFGGTLNDGAISGGSAASGIVSMTQATFYRMQTLKLIDTHLPKYKYVYGGEGGK